MRDSGIALKLILLIIPTTIAIFLFILGYYYIIFKQTIIENVENNSKNIALSAVNKIEKSLKTFEIIPKNLKYFIENSEYSEQEILNLIKSSVENNKEIFGSTIAFEPYNFNKESLYFAPYYYKVNNELKFTYLGGNDYRYFYWDWYQIPKLLNKPQWSEPYFDEGGGNIIMSTYSVPFYSVVNNTKEFKGIVTADISLNWLKKVVSSLKIAQTGYGFLISKNGTFLTHPDQSLIMNESLFSIADSKDYSNLRKLGRKMISGKSGFETTEGILSDEKFWIYYAPLPSNQWSIGIMFPEEELMGDITNLSKDAILIGIEGILILLLVIIYISRTITRPLRKLADATKDIASGNLEFDIPRVNSNDEVGNLSKSLDYMKKSLKQYIAELKETTAARERIESELKIARDIQMGFIPNVFPPYPNRSEFEIYASIEPARDVGGDFYDFYFISNDKLFFLIGDVSDKGVPASLFMAVTKTLIKAVVDVNKPLGELVYRVNNELCADNKMSLFVTLFCGILNTSSGELEYANCGHNPPIKISADGSIIELEKTGGMALGVFENSEFTTKNTLLIKDEILFLYTDGITEAMDRNGDFYGQNNMIEKLKKCYNFSAKEVVENIDCSVKEFTEDFAQTDDITMLVIKYKGYYGIKMEIELENKISELDRLNLAVTNFWNANDLKTDKLADIQLCLEELVSNIIKYGYIDETLHIIKINVNLDSSKIILEVMDDGIEFNPFDHPEPNINKPLEQREVGGLGIHLIRNCIDSFEYSRLDGFNKVKLIKNI